MLKNENVKLWWVQNKQLLLFSSFNMSTMYMGNGMMHATFNFFAVLKRHFLTTWAKIIPHFTLLRCSTS